MNAIKRKFRYHTLQKRDIIAAQIEQRFGLVEENIEKKAPREQLTDTHWIYRPQLHVLQWLYEVGDLYYENNRSDLDIDKLRNTSSFIPQWGTFQ